MKSVKINKITISNYKGIDSLNFSPKEINIIVGPNNTGKSSLLNAISLNLYSLNEFDDNNSKGLFDTKSLNPLDHQIYENNENTARISLNLSDSNGTVSLNSDLEIVYAERFPRKKFNRKAFMEFNVLESERLVNEQMREIKTRVKTRNYPQSYFDKRKAEIQDDVYSDYNDSCSNTLFFKLMLEKDIILESYVENLRRKRSYSPIFLRSSFRNYFINLKVLKSLKRKFDFNLIFRSQNEKLDIIQYFKKLTQTPNFYNVLDKLKAKLYYLYDIRESEGNLYIVTLGSDNSRIFVPFHQMGDGFQSLLITTILFELSPSGIILLEEPENCLHPGYMDMLANTLLKKSENHQVFFSTHSLELIKFIVEKAEKIDKLENILILRLNRIDNKINREILLKNEILEELKEIKVDLRGY